MSKPIQIDQPDLSCAWAEAFLKLRAEPTHRLAPLTLSFTGFDGGEVAEDKALRSALDAAISEAEMQSIHTVANTIFPQALWRRANGNRMALYSTYRENLLDYVALEPNKNSKGLYFGRLIAYDLDHKTGERLAYIPQDSIPENGNQLENIILRCRKRGRISALQASIFDPARDHTKAAQLGFPCLQHLTFVPSFSEGTLMLNVFYATQQLFAKGYGNFLGLARLGLFVADQVGLTLTRVSCFVAVEKMEQKPCGGLALDTLMDACERTIERAGRSLEK